MKPLIKNKNAEVYYRNAINKELQKLIRKMLEKVYNNFATVKMGNASYTKFNNPKNPTPSTLERLFNFFRKKWQTTFILNSEKIVNKFINLAFKRINLDSQEKLFDIGLTVRGNAKDYEEILKIIIKRNVGLIKNVSDQTINNIESVVSNAMINNQPYTEIYDVLNHQKDIVKERINLIASDQIHKTNEAINRLNQQTAGIEYFEWWGMEDARERPTHNELNGKIFKWGDIAERLPIIARTKSGIVRGYPGEAVRCRCTALAYDINLDEYEPIWLGDNKGYKFIKKAA